MPERMKNYVKKTLEAMGLSKELLSDMSGEQLATIEPVINNGFKRRLTAASTMNDDPSDAEADEVSAKNMMFSSVSHLNFGWSAMLAEIMMQEAVSNNLNTDGLDRFIRNVVGKEDQQ